MACQANNDANEDAKPASKPKPRYAWLDDLHGGVAGSLNNSAAWFDRFFAEDGTKDKNTAASAKLRLGWEPREQDLTRLKLRVRLRVRLANLQKKVDLIFDDYDEFKQEGVADEVLRETKPTESDVNVALRWIHKSDKNHYFSTRVGLASKPDMYVRALYRYIYATSDSTNLVLQPSVYYYLDQGHAERFSANFEISLSSTDMLQQNNSWRYTEIDNQVDWTHSLLHYKQLTHTQALISGVFASGITNQGYHLQNQGIFFRYRWQSLRKWIYFEVEPFVHWPEEYNFSQTLGIGLRVEGMFENK
ncbi:hypothetical protein C2869_10220 [Saccharobesus litoralis]|uniref:Uncharacterized protein n=1 Tax=Saccharobesus litoralis TaxID=2172099 RepID=A0A2S0VRD9_9ALTE|nr:hypothetical protein [Saccharobesus litoralis]AWB66778.1 hypothetical protein C2869_10220 [Saccharobesus litoralis]